jgi:hypothetical protein
MTIPELIQLGRRAKAASDRYRQDEKKLYDRRGFPRFPREEHDERVKDLKAERNEVLREVEARANEILAWAEAEAERASQFAPDAVLDSTDRGAVASRLPIFEADIASLSEDELVERLEGVLRGDSKADKVGYAMLAKKRRKKIIEQREARRDADKQPGGTRSAASTPRLTSLDGALKKLEAAALGPEAKLRHQSYSEIAQEASKISKRAFVNARDAENFAGVIAQRHSAYEIADRQRREPTTGFANPHGSIKDVNTH